MLDWIKIFDQVVASGSFSKAGRALNMAPSSIARNIDNLENHLQTTLFKRSTRQLVLTEQGQYFYQQSSKILEDTAKLVHEMKGSLDEPEGHLCISVFESFGNLFLANIIPDFLKRYPNVQVELDLDNHIVDLNNSNVDIAIRIGTPQDSRLKARHIMSNHTSLVATPKYLSETELISMPEDLTQHNCLLLNHDRRRSYWYLSNKSQVKKVCVDGNFISKGGSPLLCAALNHGGVLLLSTWMVQPYLDSGELVSVLPDWKATQNEKGSGEIFAVYKGSSYPKPHIRAFIDFILERVPKFNQ